MTAHSHSRSTLRFVGETVAVSFPLFDPNSGVIRVKAVQLLLQSGKRMQRALIPVEEPRQRLLAAKGHLFA